MSLVWGFVDGILVAVADYVRKKVYLCATFALTEVALL